MPLSPSATRELLSRLGHEPKRRLGQNFLVDGNIVRKSLALAEVAPGERVVEIGPGLGTLTAALLEAGAEVWAIERDAALHAYLAASLAPASAGRLHLMEGDAVERPLAGLPAGGPFKIVANLPYAISTPWLEAVLAGPLPDRMVLMLQKEAAERYAAEAGSKSFGAISIFLQSAYAVAPGHRVAAACFHPAPEIESRLLHLVRKPEPFVFSAAARGLIRGLFQQRRKQLGSLLRSRLPDGGAKWLEHIGAAGLSPQARPESVPPALWAGLAASVA
ncbi:MAG TPA: 16S rRNA (adenine(1518)-N(6)/adenine(1519)-N(6))-dimethyltransferase RsmA [Opitutaceae bacterium]|jgi:16S rRNA (adenine1518-N6/adenine1519-N6)-dimethyltransferase|nr:16S rRNA (adenine(1518)-N(6)/adenine(1519)-N(6))-dimethyltransferase RsmA [Opitutaceae bacterium]